MPDRCEVCSEQNELEWCPDGWDRMWWCRRHLTEHLRLAHGWTCVRVESHFARVDEHRREALIGMQIRYPAAPSGGSSDS